MNYVVNIAIDNSITKANVSLSNAENTSIWYRITGSHMKMLADISERNELKDSVNFPVLPMVWVPDTFKVRVGNAEDLFDYEVSDLTMYFISVSKPELNYQRRENEVIKPNIQPFVNAFLSQSVFNPYLYIGASSNFLEQKSEYMPDFGAKLYNGKNSLLENTDAIKITFGNFNLIYNADCLPVNQ